MSAHKRPYDEPIVMIEHSAFENAFNRLYEETMSLIEETATYIDTQGKLAARSLSTEVSAIYAKEAMYLSTRLMQVASQLLLLRAEREGEMLPEQIQKEIAKVSLHTPTLELESDHWQELPEVFRHFVARSLRLEARMQYMRNMHIAKEGEVAQPLEEENPVGKQIELLKTAFGRF
ncbi:regulator of CtrA degradation [Bartonella silvatica]|uniref:Regulator of CtrA degradation n=1 Tax=Bartonella silvatica TaxID=357760 RepID=A0ABV2HFH9_9HYPH